MIILGWRMLVCILRVRGGSSFVPDEKQEIIEYSPRARR